MAQPRAGEAGSAGLRQHALDVALVLRCGCAREGERGRPQVEVEQAVSQARLVVVVPLGLRGGDDFDLPRVQAEAFVDRANLRFGRLRVGQETRLAQLSMIAGAMVESLMSASDCVAKITDTFSCAASSTIAGCVPRRMVHQGKARLHRGSAAWAHRRNAHRSGRTDSAALLARPRGCA